MGYELHITRHENLNHITVDMKMNERKADYFTASVPLGNVYEYYHTLEDGDFVNNIIRCMDLYKAPYNAVIIHLFEKAVTLYDDMQLKELILKHFDKKPDDMVGRSELLELDPELVKPTYRESDYEFLMQLKERILKLAGRSRN